MRGTALCNALKYSAPCCSLLCSLCCPLLCPLLCSSVHCTALHSARCYACMLITMLIFPLYCFHVPLIFSLLGSCSAHDCLFACFAAHLLTVLLIVPISSLVMVMALVHACPATILYHTTSHIRLPGHYHCDWPCRSTLLSSYFSFVMLFRPGWAVSTSGTPTSLP